MREKDICKMTKDYNMIIEKCRYFEYEYIKEPFLDIHSFTLVM